MITTLQVQFGIKQLMNGIYQDLTDVQMQPVVRINNPPYEGYYTLTLTDPDAPQPSYLHWMVSNISSQGSSNDGYPLVKFEPSNPISGTHRYVFTLYYQTRHNTKLPRGMVGRSNFDNEEFAKINGLHYITNFVYTTHR